MDKFEIAFLKSHIKKAIYELEVANKIMPDCIDVDLLLRLKAKLSLLENVA